MDKKPGPMPIKVVVLYLDKQNNQMDPKWLISPSQSKSPDIKCEKAANRLLFSF